MIDETEKSALSSEVGARGKIKNQGTFLKMQFDYTSDALFAYNDDK